MYLVNKGGVRGGIKLTLSGALRVSGAPEGVSLGGPHVAEGEPTLG